MNIGSRFPSNGVPTHPQQSKYSTRIDELLRFQNVQALVACRCSSLRAGRRCVVLTGVVFRDDYEGDRAIGVKMPASKMFLEAANAFNYMYM